MHVLFCSHSSACSEKNRAKLLYLWTVSTFKKPWNMTHNYRLRNKIETFVEISVVCKSTTITMIKMFSFQNISKPHRVVSFVFLLVVRCWKNMRNWLVGYFWRSPPLGCLLHLLPALLRVLVIHWRNEKLWFIVSCPLMKSREFDPFTC